MYRWDTVMYLLLPSRLQFAAVVLTVVIIILLRDQLLDYEAYQPI